MCRMESIPVMLTPRTTKDVADADHCSLESFNGCHDSLVVVVMVVYFSVKFGVVSIMSAGVVDISILSL